MRAEEEERRDGTEEASARTDMEWNRMARNEEEVVEGKGRDVMGKVDRGRTEVGMQVEQKGNIG